MRFVRPIMLVAAVAMVFVACGGDDEATVEQGGGSSTTVATTLTTAGATATTGSSLAQPAIWPAADVVFATPEEAATDFVTKVLDVPPQLGEFQAGDSRSGEIEVLCCTEGGGDPSVRSVLLLRQLGPSDGWFVIGAVSDAQTIAEPESMAEVAGEPLTVSGTARGFEGTVVVEAFIAGNATALDQEIAQGGPFETPEPFSVSVDLSAAQLGDVVMLLVRGGVGLETDPGDFSAIPVVVMTLPATG